MQFSGSDHVRNYFYVKTKSDLEAFLKPVSESESSDKEPCDCQKRSIKPG